MISEERKTKHNGGRPRKAVKRDIVTGIRFTKLEYYVVKQKAARAGLGISVYVRDMALRGRVIQKINDEERQFVRQLIGMSNNLNQLAKRCHQEGALTAILHFERYRKAFDELIEQLKK